MLIECHDGKCSQSPRWMTQVLWAAGIYHLLFGVWANCWPGHFFHLLGIEQPNHPGLWRCLGFVIGVLGFSLCIASKNPVSRWAIVLLGLLKSLAVTFAISHAVSDEVLPAQVLWMLAFDDVIWIYPFLAILWKSIQAHAGIPPSRAEPLSILEAAETYKLSTGETLLEASKSRVLTLVFLRHFGCTFTRQILRSLEGIQEEARVNGSELVLVHMLQGGKETVYLGERSGVTRIADPRCELYRAFGLGKGGFLELFGPRVWWRGAVAIFRGCGVGHLVGDGLQMPGAFLFRDGQIVSTQRARSASDLPNLEHLFRGIAVATSSSVTAK
jgi:hypothetical protein